MKLTSYIFTILALSGLIASLATGYFVYQSVVDDTMDHLSTSQLERTRHVMRNLDGVLQHAFHSITAISNFYSHGKLPDGANADVERRILRDVADEITTPWEAVHIIDKTGGLRLSTEYLHGPARQSTESNPLHFDALFTAELTNTWSTDLIQEPASKKPVFLFASVIRDKTLPDHPSIGVAIGYFSWYRFEEILDNAAGTQLTLLNRDGSFIASNNPYHSYLTLEKSFASHQTIQSQLRAPQAEEATNKGIKTSLHDEGIQVIQSLAIEQGHFEKAGNGWILVAETPIDTVLAQARRVGIQNAFLNSGMIFLGFGLTYLVLRREVTSPISSLYQAIQSISQEKFDIRLQQSHIRTQEMQALSTAMNDMALKLGIAKEHSNQAHRLQRMVDQSVSGHMTVNQDFVVTYCNEATIQIFEKHIDKIRLQWPNFETSKLVGKSIDPYLEDPESQHKLLSNPQNLPIRTDVSISDATLHITVTAVHNESGQYDGIAVEWLDVTEEREATRLQQEAERALRETVQELDKFTYVASHDLRTPLNGISLLAEWITEEDARNLSPKSFENLNRIHDRCQRLGRLLDDLLAYSKSGKVLGEIREVDTSQLLRELREILDPHNNYKVHHSGAIPLPSFNTYNAPFELVFRNLIQNAIKHHDQPTGNIYITCDDSASETFQFFVTDDGPGIPEDHQDKIFGMFKSFTGSPDGGKANQSSGIGLAIIKKTVESFGCTVSVNSSPGQGSTFAFTWPKKVQPTREEA